MEENGFTKQYTKRVWQAISVPFLWEERPGAPIKDWKLEEHGPICSPDAEEVAHATSLPPPPPPIKLIASIPFKWEQKPGTPLINVESISENLVETIPSDQNITEEMEMEMEIPSSPASSDTDGSTSSYATGSSSPVGSSFLECMFPLYQPTDGFLEKVGSSKKIPLTQQQVMINNELDMERNDNVVVRRAPTLGELIMMSRRRSCQRRADQVRRHSVSTEFMQKGVLGCCFFGTDHIKTISRFSEKQKYQPRLSLM